MSQFFSRAFCYLCLFFQFSVVVCFIHSPPSPSSSFSVSILNGHLQRQQKLNLPRVFQSSTNANPNTNKNAPQRNSNNNPNQNQNQNRPRPNNNNNNGNRSYNGNNNGNNNGNRSFNGNNSNNNNSRSFNTNQQTRPFGNQGGNNGTPRPFGNQNNNNGNNFYQNRNNHNNNNNNFNNNRNNNNSPNGGMNAQDQNRPQPIRNIPNGPLSNPRTFSRNPKAVEEDVPLMNEQIRAKEVRCIVAGGEDGDEMLGVMTTGDALSKAKEMDVDLVMISDKSDPPVCKIIDYGKYRFQQEKKKKEAKKKSKGQEVKEIKMSYKIENHDYLVRRKQVEKFISAGDRVKCLIQFRGREQQHFDIGHQLLNQINEDLEDTAVMESGIKKEGNRLICYFKPTGEKKK